MLPDGWDAEVSLAGAQPKVESTQRLGLFGSFLCLTKINWGIGMMAMPYYMHLAGPWCGIVFFTISICLAADGVMCLVRIPDASTRPCCTYAELVGSRLGIWGRRGALLSLLLANWGSAVAWIKFMGDNLHKFLPEVAASSAEWSLAVTVLTLPCALVESVEPLKRVSFAGLLAGQLFVVILVAQAAVHWRHFGDYLATARPGSGWQGLPIAMGIAVFCNEGMVVVTPSVHAEMRAPRWYPVALACMAVFFWVNYLAAGLAGDFLFGYVDGRPVQDEATLSLGLSGLHRAAVYSYVLQLALTFPVMLFAVFVSFEDAWAGHRCGRVRVRLARAGAIVFAGALAVLVPRFGDFLALSGALGNSLGIYVLPQLCLLRATEAGRPLASGRRRILSWTIVLVFGIACGAVATVVSFQQLL